MLEHQHFFAVLLIIFQVNKIILIIQLLFSYPKF